MRWGVFGRLNFRTGYWTAVLSCILQLHIAAFAETPANFDLSSTERNFRADNPATQPVSVTSGARTRAIVPGSMLTAAESVAVNQILATGQQSIMLSRNGAAIGGQLNLGRDLGQAVQNMVIPKGVMALGDFSAISNLIFSGNLNNAGSLYAYSTSANGSGTFNANNIKNDSGALISSILPRSLATTLGTPRQSLDLSLIARESIVNHGMIESSGALSLAANNIVNASSANNIASLQAANGINLLSANITNSGTITALAGNINVNSATAANLNFNNTGGTLSALAGDINFRDSTFTEKFDVNLNGGNIYSRELNLNSGCGTVSASIGDISSKVNVGAGQAYVSANSDILNLGTLKLSDDPIFYNIGGSLHLTGDITTSGNFLALIAKQDIIHTSGVIDTSSSTGGGRIVMVAGWQNKPAGANTQFNNVNNADLLFVGASPTGGKVDLTGTTLVNASGTSGNANGGVIEITAFAGTNEESGRVTIPCSVDIGGSGSGQNGSLRIIAGSPLGVSIAVTSVNAIGGTRAGFISLEAATPVLSGSGQLLVQHGNLLSCPTFHGESLQQANIQFETIDTIGVTVNIQSRTVIYAGVINNYPSPSPSIPMSVISLDLTDPIIVRQIANLQQVPDSGIGGSMWVANGDYAIGGNLTLSSSLDLSNLSALNLIAAVAVSFQDFQQANPINVNIGPTSHSPRALIGSTTSFVSSSGNSNPVITVIGHSIDTTSEQLVVYGDTNSDGSLTFLSNGTIAVTSNHLTVGGDLLLKTLPGSNANISVGGLQTSFGTTTLEVDGSGYILQYNSSSRDNIITASKVILKSDTGDIGKTLNSGSIGRPLYLRTPDILIESDGGNSYIKALEDASLTIESQGGLELEGLNSLICHTSEVGGNFKVTAAHNLSLQGNLTSVNGAQTFIAGHGGSGNLDIGAGSSLMSNGGSIILQNDNVTNGTISIGANSTLFAHGKVAISIGQAPSTPNPGTAPDHVITSESLGGEIFFGTNGITTAAPDNQITAYYSDVIFDTKGLDATSISLDGNVTISSSHPVLSNLNFSNDWATWTTIQQLQAAGLLGGTLEIVHTIFNTLPQGTVIIGPDMITPVLGYVHIIQGVHVTFTDFDSDHPINVGPNGLNTGIQFSLDGQLDFVNTNSAIINISNLPWGVNINGTLTSSGSLTFSTQSPLQNYGTITANGALTMNLGQSFQNGNHFGTTSPPAYLNGTTVMINSQSADPFFFLGVGSITSQSGTTIRSASGSIIIGEQGWNACRQTITGPARLESAFVYISKDSFIHVSNSFTVTADSIVNEGGPNALVGHPLIYGYDGRPLANLNMDNPIVAAKLLDAQSQGAIDGTLIIRSGKIVGGTLILHPDDLTSSLTSLVIPKGVQVTFEGFDTANPLSINISSASSNKQIVINGQTIFSDGTAANGVINIISDFGGTVLNVGRSGLLSSTGTLALNANGNMIIAGGLVGEVSLSTTGSIILNENIGSADKPFSITLNGTGSVTQMAGKVLRASTLTLVGSNGNFGSAKSAIKVETENLAATTGGIVNIANTKALNLLDSTASSLLVSAVGGLTVHNVHSTGGPMDLVSKGGVLQVAAGSEVKSIGGSLTIQNTDQRFGSISIASDVALLGTGMGSKHLMAIVIGPVPGMPVVGSLAGNTVTLLNEGKVYFGKSGITSTDNSFTADGRKLIFSTGRLPASAIIFENDITTTATSQNIGYEVNQSDLDIYIDTGDTCDEESESGPIAQNSQ
jgi:hypothetical protein